MAITIDDVKCKRECEGEEMEGSHMMDPKERGMAKSKDRPKKNKKKPSKKKKK